MTKSINKKVMLIVILVGASCLCLFFILRRIRNYPWSPKNPHFSSEVWDEESLRRSKESVPKINSRGVSLGFQSAAVFHFSNDDMGYVRFHKADKWHALYESGLLVVSNASLLGFASVTNGLVTLTPAEKDSQLIRCGDNYLWWFSFAGVHYYSDFERVSLVPVNALYAGNKQFTNELTWVDLSGSMTRVEFHTGDTTPNPKDNPNEKQDSDKDKGNKGE